MLGISLGFLFSAAYLSDLVDVVADDSLLLVVSSVGLKLTAILLKSAFKAKVLQSFTSLRRELVLLTIARRSF